MSILLEKIVKEFGADRLLTDPTEAAPWGKDWTTVFKPRPLGVFFPQSTDEVSRVLGWCNEIGVAVVPSGGRTGLAAGAVAAKGELVLNLSRMNHMQDVNAITQTVRVQAGAVTQAVHEHCKPHGLTWPIDLASKGSSQVGGNIATNAGGVRVVRYGHVRHWVLALKVVLMDGTVLELNGDLEKNNSGYDLRHLMIGSEGTLGVITEATLKLTRLPEQTSVFFFGLESLNAVLKLLRETRKVGAPLMAFECLTQACLSAVHEKIGLPKPFATDSPYYALVELETGQRMDDASLDQWLEDLFERSIVQEGVVARSSEDARRLWGLRENITESLSRMGVVYKNDVSLPIMALEMFTEAFLRESPQWYPGCQTFVFGHIGDGNLHINVLKPESMAQEAFIGMCEAANHPLFTLIQKHQGSIAAEHGIGLLKKAYLSYCRRPEEILLFQGIKKSFDPRGLLNPGKIFDVPRA